MSMWKVYYTFNLKSEYGDRYKITNAETQDQAISEVAKVLDSKPHNGFKITNAEIFETNNA